jgi:hypothetical protein
MPAGFLSLLRANLMIIDVDTSTTYKEGGNAAKHIMSLFIVSQKLIF